MGSEDRCLDRLKVSSCKLNLYKILIKFLTTSISSSFLEIPSVLLDKEDYFTPNLTLTHTKRTRIFMTNIRNVCFFPL